VCGIALGRAKADIDRQVHHTGSERMEYPHRARNWRQGIVPNIAHRTADTLCIPVGNMCDERANSGVTSFVQILNDQGS
jgi:hypothetical protein